MRRAESLRAAVKVSVVRSIAYIVLLTLLAMESIQLAYASCDTNPFDPPTCWPDFFANSRQEALAECQAAALARGGRTGCATSGVDHFALIVEHIFFADQTLAFYWFPPSGCPAGEQFVGPPPGTCQSTCPIAPLAPIADPCAQSLEAGRGVDVNGACPSLTPTMQQAAQCLANKITSLGISYPGPEATIRSTAYQSHLKEIWTKDIALKALADPAVIQGCATRRAEISAELTNHHLTARPANPSSSKHETGEAVDVGTGVAKALIENVPAGTSDVEDYINSATVNPPPCNLRWGGRFQNPYDPVHFELP